MTGERRVAVINDASFYVGPDLARNLARRGHDLVLGDAPAALVEELTAMGAAVETVDGARMHDRSVALEVARRGVQVNVLGTSFRDFPEFLPATRVPDADSRGKVEAQVPMGRLGTLEEFASFCMPFLDGTSRFTTGQF